MLTTDLELAEEFGVTTVTIWRWQSSHEEFCKALREGKEAFDDRVERSLAMRAIGYSFHSEKIMRHQGSVMRESYVEHIPPDPGAAKQWLTNRRPDKWRDRQELSGPGGKPLQFHSVGDELEAARKVAFFLSQALVKARQQALTIEGKAGKGDGGD
jgi:hypothetical protein